MDACGRLDPHYAASRHPDVADGNPANNYTATIAEELLEFGEEVYTWCSSQLRP